MIRLLIFIFCQIGYCYEYTLAIATVFKDEAPYLKEWIEYHKLMGVEHFRLYNNDSKDDYLSVLQPYIDSGEVDLINWTSKKQDLTNWLWRTQWPACANAIRFYRGKSQWLALIDVDEFLHPLSTPDMVSFLEDYEDYPAVVLNWQCFGTSFVPQIPKGKLLIEMLTKKALDNHVHNIAVKSIVQPSCVNLGKVTWPPHTYHYRENRLAIFSNLEERPNNFDFDAWKICLDKAVINHYVHRSEEYFWKTKIEKKLRMENGKALADEYISQWYENCNQIEDLRILRFAQQLKERVFSDPPFVEKPIEPSQP